MSRRFHFWICLGLIFSACAHEPYFIGETAAPLQLNAVDCVKFVIMGDADALKSHLDHCKNFKNSEGISPLMMTAYKNRPELMDLLLVAGSNVHQKDNSGSDALFYAVNFNRVKMIQMLRDKGAKITMNEFKVNALWVALQKSNFDVIKTLNPSIDEVNLQGEDGWNASYFAIRREEKEVFDFILGKGVQVNIKDSEGVSPYLFAKDEVKWTYAAQKLAPITAVEYKKK